MASLRKQTIYLLILLFASIALLIASKMSLLLQARVKALRGDTAAQSYLGFAYYRGTEVRKDSAEAVKWWKKAADKGDLQSQQYLGWVYASGDGVPRDFSEAVSWWRKAAEQGNPKAQASLGLAYYKGEGLPRDYAQAFCWFSMAEKRSGGSVRQEYATFRDDAAGKLTLDQLAEARRNAEELDAKYPKR